jgi:hypothetical protein
MGKQTKDEVMLMTEQVGALRGALMEACVLYVDSHADDVRERGPNDKDRRIKELLDFTGIRHFAEFQAMPWWES